MCLECIAIALSSLPNGAHTIAKLAEDRDLGQSVGRVRATLPIKTTTTVVLNDTLPIQDRDSLAHLKLIAAQIGRTASLRTTSTQIDDIPSEPQSQSIF